MRRSAALAPLSRDHHHALVVAMTLARASEATAASAAMLFADFILGHEVRHFDVEESLLLPALVPGEAERLLAERVLADHRYLRGAAERLKQDQTPQSVDAVQALGTRLRTHVQLEERELFPCIERTLDSEDLERIGAQIVASESDPQATARRSAIRPGGRTCHIGPIRFQSRTEQPAPGRSGT